MVTESLLTLPEECWPNDGKVALKMVESLFDLLAQCRQGEIKLAESLLA